MFLEDISHVLRPHLNRSCWVPEFSEDTLLPSDCVSFSCWVSGSSVNLEATQASGGNCSDPKDHKQKHSNPFK